MTERKPNSWDVSGAMKERQRIEKYIKRRIRVLKSMAKHNRASDVIWTECKVRVSELERVLDVIKKR